MRTFFYSLITANLLFFSMNCHGQSKLDSLQHLQEVVVTAKAMQEIIPTQSLSGLELKKLSAHSVADAIRYFSGIQIKDYGGIGGLKTANIRSLGTNHVGVFYDGIELGNAQNGTIDLGRFSLDNMEQVTVYNGQKSAIFQSAKDFGSAGTIYLKSRTPNFEFDNKRYHLKTAFKTGSFGLANPSFLWEQKISSKVNASLSSEYMYTTGKYKFQYKTKQGYDTTAVRHNGDVEAIRIEAGLYGKITDGLWRTKVYYYQSERGYPGAIVRNKFTHEDRQWDKNFFAQGTFKKEITSKYGILVNGKFAYDYLHYLSDPNKDETTMYVNNSYYQSEAYLSTANRYKINSSWDANISVDYQWNKLDANLKAFVYPRRHTLLAAVATAYHTDRFKMQGSLLGTFVKENITTNELIPNQKPSKKKKEFTPTVIAYYQPLRECKGFNIRAFYKRIFRMPTLNDLYYTFIGNSALDPEYTNQYNVGLTYEKKFRNGALKRVELKGDVYYNEIENKIVATPTANFFRWTMINLGKVEIRGVDAKIETNWKINKLYLNGKLTYTYQKAQDFTNPKDKYYGGQIPYIPWHSGSAIINTSYKNFGCNYSFIYIGERYMSSANTKENYQLPWYTSDLSFDYTTSIKNREYRIAIEVNNLLNQQYEVVRSYPMPGRNYKITLNFNI